MQGFKAKFKVAALVLISIWMGLAALYDLIKPVSNGCIMTYMYPQYIPISSPANVSSSKYGLYLYHEGWKKIDYNEHIKKLSGVPVLFIPGNGGSYKQVRSLAAESDRAYQGGPLERTFYQEASLTLEEGGVNWDAVGFGLPRQYNSKLDWFTVDLEGEHSAMDGRILEEHTEYVVHAIHRILDQYKDSHDGRVREGAAVSGSLPKSVILVGHSMGGFVARAAIVHPCLRKLAVETVLTLSSPHQSPPVALQPSLGLYYARVNEEWRKGYEVQTSRTGRYASDPPLSRVVVVSISGGIHDYQVRTKLESLDGIVPRSHGFMISSSAMKNVWLSMEHQVILWCNQLVVQVAHTLLSLIDPEMGQPFLDTPKRLAVFTKMLHSGIPQSFDWLKQSPLSQQAIYDRVQNGKEATGPRENTLSSCPSNVRWTDDGLDRDLYIQTSTVTILAMDGRRRWLDIEKLGSNRERHFVLVTNLAPCSGIRLHLWPEKGKSASNLPASRRVIEVTQKMVHIPSGPAPRQIEPGSQTEQAPPSAVLFLSSSDMRGFRFLTISIAPRPTVSGQPPPAASMAVGQFFSPKEGELELSSKMLLLSSHFPQGMILKEDHPLAVNLSFTISLGLLPIRLSLETTGCGIKKSALPDEEAGDVENSRLCKLRCFPPVALAWDATSGLHIFPNLYSTTIEVDSSPALWGSTRGSEKTTVLLLVDPHCSYRASVAVSVTAAARRFFLLYCSEIVGFSVAVVFFALMRQAQAWELDLPIPSVLSAVQSNLRMPLPFSFLATVPLFIALFLSSLTSQPFPPFLSFVLVSILCYIFANGLILLLILILQLVFYVTAALHVFVKQRWQLWELNFCFVFLHWFLNLSSCFLSSKVIRALRTNPLFVTAVVAIALVCFVHPALGLFILLLSHALSCHNALSSHTRSKESFDSRNGGNRSEQFSVRHRDGFSQSSLLDDGFSSRPGSTGSFGDTQLEMFHHRHGLLILHLLAALMFGPSLMAWFQRIGMGQSFPWFVDIALCGGVILHGICDSKPEFNFFLFPLPGVPGLEVKLSFGYLLAGCYSYLSALALAPYRAFYAMAAIGVLSFTFRIILRWNRGKGEAYVSTRKHSHRH
ncbi:uncharacterized protein LOC127803797 isoform X2 [Diospyros lotus]|uniref:uncharacterized protein LOC127803797 isoform X2 n=1 Tax=Diospyros lotus TaxID=55363 RepID=UPI00225A1A30|nr:uncharacterized protein LOC127803797 isoform X2 [Diospyros lotus]